MLKYNKKLAVKTTYINDRGKNISHPNFINWSYLYRGTIAFTKENNINKNNILKINHKGDGISLNGKKSTGDNQPPKNKIEPIAHISNIFAYSPSQNIAYIIPEYSV